MSRDAFKDWLAKHFVQILIASLTAAIALGAMEVTVGTKADKIEVEQLRSAVSKKADRDSVMDVLRRVDASTRRIERYICRRNPNDLGC